jgi:hypothetical protein
METTINQNPTICYTAALCREPVKIFNVYGRSEHKEADICLKTNGVDEFFDYCDSSTLLTTVPTYYGDNDFERVLRNDPIERFSNRGAPLRTTSLRVMEAGCTINEERIEALSPGELLGCCTFLT